MYNIGMNTLYTNRYTEIDVPDHATSAAEWCKFNNIDYRLEFWGWPGSTRYRFIFENDHDLVLFSLKWT